MWKRIGIFLFCCALFMSIWKDLTIGSPVPATPAEPNMEEPVQDKKQESNQETFQPVLLQVKQGDTLLSVANELNNHDLRVTMEQVIVDFEELNPGKDPYALDAGSAYYFPHYLR
ncbi:LysM domain-containing protein [Terribacillus goriensis]|uniref:type IV pilus assembly protein FimV n=1 Tax=Terribacillus saccharophilus TaxID=361277 RepID=UPI003982F3EA